MWIPHEKKKKKKKKKKIVAVYFFSGQNYALSMSYGPLEKYGCNLVSRISKKTIETRALKHDV